MSFAIRADSYDGVFRQCFVSHAARICPRICDAGIFTACLNDECSTKTIFFRMEIISF
nr:MAG TPA: hypothetical protein [Caudoviricetes sp.]DAL79161.1 MAG TPA: hypothetical protein [Caudoviricetes sp.]DAW87052.1 MAG TPA: hypothetical protein [Caudoviricetes sp.]